MLAQRVVEKEEEERDSYRESAGYFKEWNMEVVDDDSALRQVSHSVLATDAESDTVLLLIAAGQGV